MTSADSHAPTKFAHTGDIHTPKATSEGHDLPDRRAHRRLAMRLPTTLRGMQDAGPVVRGVTDNISTGGLYIELDRRAFRPGDRIGVEVEIPPDEGVSAYPGIGVCEAQVLRCGPAHRDDGGNPRFGLAARFLDLMRMRY
jgi:hypothetical protein